MKKINRGKFDYNNKVYTKYVKFGSAVLWMSRQLSVPMIVMDIIKTFDIQVMQFIDLGKREMWKFKSSDVFALGEVKQVGQEKQWYFPIDKAIRKKMTGGEGWTERREV